MLPCRSVSLRSTPSAAAGPRKCTAGERGSFPDLPCSHRWGTLAVVAMLASKKRRGRSQPEEAAIVTLPGVLCASCDHYRDIMSESCDGPVHCPFACPHVEPERARDVARWLGPIV